MIHIEVSWHDDSGTLSIIPDITIIEPENLSILHSLRRRRVIGLRENESDCPMIRQYEGLPNKRFEFAGKAINFELKFYRSSLTAKCLDELEETYRKVEDLFGILDRRGDGEDLYAYIVVFQRSGVDNNRNAQRLNDFLRDCGTGRRHKIIYKKHSRYIREY